MAVGSVAAAENLHEKKKYGILKGFAFAQSCLSRKVKPSLDIVLSPHRTQFYLARCMTRSRHGCDLDTVPN